MIGLDTNVLVRYLTQDDAVQARVASAAIEAAAGRGERLRLTAVTLCELVWVLESAYHQSRADVARAFARIVRTADFDLEHADHVRTAWSGTDRHQLTSRMRSSAWSTRRPDAAHAHVRPFTQADPPVQGHLSDMC